MLKPKISIKPVIDIVSYTKKIIYKSAFKKTELKKSFKLLAKNHIFDNYIALVLIIWINKNKNIFKEKINVKSLWFQVKKISKNILDIFIETYNFAIDSKSKNPDYISSKNIYENEADKIALKIINLFENNASTNSSEELNEIKNSIKSLLIFNFIDLYTEKIKIIQANEDEKKYDWLINLIEIQMNLLDESYEMFRSVNSVNFNLIFKILVSLRKSII